MLHHLIGQQARAMARLRQSKPSLFIVISADGVGWPMFGSKSSGKELLSGQH